MNIGSKTRQAAALTLAGIVALSWLGCGSPSTPAAPPGPTPETVGQKLRRLYVAAQAGNPTLNAPLKVQAAWSADTAFHAGQVVANGGNLYLAMASGTSASAGGPSGTGMGRIADGTLTWSYVGAPPISADDPAAPTLTVAAAAPPGLPVYVPALLGGAAENSAAFALGSNGVTRTTVPFLAVSEGPKIAVPIVTVTGSNSTVAVTTASPHNYAPGQTIVASGFAPANFNAPGGTPITVTGANTYVYAAAGPVSGAPAVLGSVDAWNYGNSGATQDWFGSGYLQAKNDGQATFYTDAPLVTMVMSGSARIAVDMRYLDLGVQASVGNPNYYTLDFSAVGGRKLRQLRIEGVVAPVWYGAYTAAGDQIYAPPAADVIKAQFVGDSFFNANDVTPLTIADEAGVRLGWLNAVPSNNGGSGFVSADYSSPNYVLNYVDRLADVKAIAPDVLVYVTSGNDNGYPYAAVLANMLTCLRQARAWFPDMPIFVLELQSWGENAGSIASAGTTVTVTVTAGHGLSSGEFVTMANVVPAGYNGTYPVIVTGPTTFTYQVAAPLPPSNSTLFYANRTAAAARNAVAQLRDPLTWFVPTISDPAGSWFSGSGNITNPKGDGNADLYVGPDGVHPEVRGAKYLGARIALSIGRLLPAIP